MSPTRAPALNGNAANIYVLDAPLGPQFRSPPRPFSDFLREFLSLEKYSESTLHFMWQILSPALFFDRLDQITEGSIILLMDFMLQEGGWAGEPKPYDATLVHSPRMWALLNHTKPLMILLHSDRTCMFDATPDVWANSHHVIYRNTWSSSLHKEWRRSHAWEHFVTQEPSTPHHRRPWLKCTLRQV